MGRDQKLPKPDLTIVGGQPRDDHFDPAAVQTEVPVGFEMLLYRAAQDPASKEQLLADRDAAAAEWGIQLRPSERATLETVSDDMLRRMIDRIEPTNPQRSRFMVNVAAAVTSLAAGTVAMGVVEGCGDDGSGGGATTSTTTIGVGGASAGVQPGGSGGLGAGPVGGGGDGGQGATGGDSGGGGAGGAAGGSAGAGG